MSHTLVNKTAYASVIAINGQRSSGPGQLEAALYGKATVTLLRFDVYVSWRLQMQHEDLRRYKVELSLSFFHRGKRLAQKVVM